MNRRAFLKVSSGLLVTGLVPSLWRLEAFAANRSLERIGLQLYTVRSRLQEDFEGTLRQVSEIGFHEVEFAGYYDRNPEQVKSLLDALGLDAPATHVSLGMVRDDLERLIDLAGTIGHRYLVVPSLPAAERTTLNFYRRVAETFNKVGERCRRAGLTFAYHNHAFEFEPIDGRIPYDLLLEETDPALVEMELDLFWIVQGGHDPLDYFERYPGRFTLCHVKDRDDAGNMTDVGKGSIDFASIFARFEQAGLKHYFVEHDRPESPLESVRSSFEYLSRLRF